MLMKVCLLVVLLSVAAPTAAEDNPAGAEGGIRVGRRGTLPDAEVERTPQDSATREANRKEAIGEFFSFFTEYVNQLGKAQDAKTIMARREALQGAMLKLHAKINDESPDDMLKKPKANAEPNEKTIALTREEKEIARLPFKAALASDGKASEHDYPHGQHAICEIGPIRFVFMNRECHGQGSSSGLMCSGHASDVAFGLHGGSGGNTVGVFAHLSLGEVTTAVLNKTPMVISRHVMRLANKYFDLKGKRTVIFMYSDDSFDKIVVREN